MKLSRIRIEQFKQFRQPLEITDLEPGINLFTGPNEAGKSTLVTAIRAAFFERHRSSSVDDFRPWGDSSASPTVELEFSVGNTTHRLTKSFLSKKRCELQIGTQRLNGNEAEDHLATLLGFEYAGRGASTAEHWGIPGLLWIQQGSAQNIRDSVMHASDHLRTALNESLGEVASSSGDGVLATVEASRSELLTEANGAPRGQYAEAIRQDAALAASVHELDTQIAVYRQNVDTLATLRREHIAEESEKPWVGFREQQRIATERLVSAERIQQALAADKERVVQIEERTALLRSQLEIFANQEREVVKRGAALESVTQSQSAATALAEQWQSKLAEAAQYDEAARAALRLARQEDTRSRLVREREDIHSKVTDTSEALAKAEAEQTILRELQSLATASEIASADLSKLREQDLQIRELRIRQNAAATRLHFALSEGQSLQISGESVTGSGQRLLVGATTVTLPGLGELEIAPGGADLEQLKRKETELTDQHVALLQRLGLPSATAVELRHQAHTQQQADIKASSATVKSIAPRGIDALRTELVVHRARAEEIQQTLRQLPPSVESSWTPQSVAETEAAEDVARKSLAQINESLSKAQITAGNAQSAFGAATRELANAQALIDAPGRAARLATTNQNLTDARAEVATLNERIETKAKEVEKARPDILKQDIDRYRRSAEQHERSFNDRRERLMRIDVELETSGAQGLEERRAELLRDRIQAERRLAELRRRAAALNHLLNLLREKRRALTRRLQAPLQNHLTRYLQLLFPQASLDIDEDLTPGPLTRLSAHGAESGAFDALSFGAREQMGVISRLAYADLLREAGRPTLVILDDALVNSDEERLAQMKRVLFDAATRHQILLLTCHKEKWRDIGVIARALESASNVAQTST